MSISTRCGSNQHPISFTLRLLLLTLPFNSAAGAEDVPADSAEVTEEAQAQQVGFLHDVKQAQTTLVDFLARMDRRFGTADLAKPARETVAALDSLQELAAMDARVARDFSVTLGDLLRAAWRRAGIYEAQIDWVSPQPELVAPDAERGPIPYSYFKEHQRILDGILRDYAIGARPYSQASIARYRRGITALDEKQSEVEELFNTCLVTAADELGRFGYAIGEGYRIHRERNVQANTLEQQRLQTDDPAAKVALAEQIELLKDQAYEAYRRAKDLQSAFSERTAAAFGPCFEQLRLAVSAPVMSVLPRPEDLPVDCQPEIVWRCVRPVGPVVRVAAPALELLDVKTKLDADKAAEKIVEAAEKSRSSQISGVWSILSRLGLSFGGERSSEAAGDKVTGSSGTTIASQVEARAEARVAASERLSQERVRERIEKRNIQMDLYTFTANTQVTGQSRWLVKEIEAYVAPSCPASVPAPTLITRVEKGPEITGRFRNAVIEVSDAYYPDYNETGRGRAWATARAKTIFLNDLERNIPAIDFPPPRDRSGNLHVSAEEAKDCIRR